MRDIRKLTSALLAACLLAGLCAGCSGKNSANTPEIISQSQPPASESQPQPNAAEPQDAGALTVMLPGDKAELGEGLVELAAQDGNFLLVRTAAAGEQYTRAVESALQSAEPPDILWLEGEGALLQLGAENGDGLFDLTSESAGPVMGGLTAMVPEADAVPGGGKLAALPTGYYAEGYLVNIELLAQLLSAQNTDSLLDDLYACNFEQWQTLIRSIESYLARPGRIELRLAQKRYTMPNYRPSGAQPLRGVFAAPTADADALIGNALDIIMGLCYESPAEMAAASEAERAALLKPVLAAMMGMLELETIHMTQSSGPLRRGEAYAEQEHPTAQEAEEMFANGTALFMRGNSRTGLKIEQENPQLAGKLAIIPIKLPSPSYIQEVDREQEGTGEADVSRTEEGDSSADADASNTTEAEENSQPQEAVSIPGELAESVIENSNLGLWYASDGLLCINGDSRAKNAAMSLLLRLYTTEEGQYLLENGQQLYPFSQPYPESRLAGQVAAELGAGGWKLVAAPTTLEQPRAVMGEYLQRVLLEQYIWDESLQQQFMTNGFAAMGLSYTSTTPSTQPPVPDEQSSSGSASE